MKLSRLSLRDFRGFQQLDLDLDPQITVLVGVNGSGKSSVLEAIRLLLAGAFGQCFALPYSWGTSQIEVSDIREGRATTELAMSANLVDDAWTFTLQQQRSPPVQADGIFDHRKMTASEEEQADWLAVCYSTRRALLDDGAQLAAKETDILDQWAAFEDTLSWRASLQPFVTWFRAREDVENESRLREDPGFRDPQLQAVRKALTSVTGGYDNLFVQRRPREVLMLSKQGKKLALNQLSDGEKCLLTMVGDLARRMAMVAREGQEPSEVEAVVMIDEIELHLHPGLQRTILPGLMKAFPNTQFIVSTHSPQVLSSVPSARVRLLENFELRPLDRGTWRRDTNRILETAFGDPGRPPSVAEKINRLRDLIDALEGAEDTDHLRQARQLIGELHGEIEGEDPDVFFLEQLLPPEDGAEVAG